MEGVYIVAVPSWFMGLLRGEPFTNAMIYVVDVHLSVSVKFRAFWETVEILKSA